MYWNYILLFVATGLFCFIVINMTTRYLLEKLELNSNARYEALRRFISPQKLMLSRIFAALICGCVMFIVQLALGVEQMKIAVPVACGFGIAGFFGVYWFFLQQLIRAIPRGPSATRMGTGLSCGHQSGSLRSPS